MMEYIILTNSSVEGLQVLVNEFIGEGFKPIGGVAAGVVEEVTMGTNGQEVSHNDTLLQAMIKD